MTFITGARRQSSVTEPASQNPTLDDTLDISAPDTATPTSRKRKRSKRSERRERNMEVWYLRQMARKILEEAPASISASGQPSHIRSHSRNLHTVENNEDSIDVQ